MASIQHEASFEEVVVLERSPAVLISERLVDTAVAAAVDKRRHAYRRRQHLAEMRPEHRAGVVVDLYVAQATEWWRRGIVDIVVTIQRWWRWKKWFHRQRAIARQTRQLRFGIIFDEEDARGAFMAEYAESVEGIYRLEIEGQRHGGLLELRTSRRTVERFLLEQEEAVARAAHVTEECDAASDAVHTARCALLELNESATRAALVHQYASSTHHISLMSLVAECIDRKFAALTLSAWRLTTAALGQHYLDGEDAAARDPARRNAIKALLRDENIARNRFETAALQTMTLLVVREAQIVRGKLGHDPEASALFALHRLCKGRPASGSHRTSPALAFTPQPPLAGQHQHTAASTPRTGRGSRASSRNVVRTPSTAVHATKPARPSTAAALMARPLFR